MPLCKIFYQNYRVIAFVLLGCLFCSFKSNCNSIYCMNKTEGSLTNRLVVKEIATRIASFPAIRLRSERNIVGMNLSKNYKV